MAERYVEVAAGWAGIHRACTNRDLSKGVIYVHTGPGRFCDNGDFAGQAICAAKAVNLSVIWGTHGG